MTIGGKQPGEKPEEARRWCGAENVGLVADFVNYASSVARLNGLIVMMQNRHKTRQGRQLEP